MILMPALNNAIYVEPSTPSTVDLSPAAIAAVADAVWDEQKSAHQVAGSFGELEQETHQSADRAGSYNL